MNRQALRVALTPFVPLSRLAGEGDMECGSEASAHAEANASALQTGKRVAPLSHIDDDVRGLARAALPKQVSARLPSPNL